MENSVNKSDGLFLIKNSLKKTRMNYAIVIGAILFLCIMQFGVLFLGWDLEFQQAALWMKVSLGLFFILCVALLFFAAKIFIQNINPEKSPIWITLTQNAGSIAWAYTFYVRGKTGQVLNASLFIFLTDGKRLVMNFPIAWEQTLLNEIAQRAPRAKIGFTPEREKIYRQNPTTFREMAR